MSKTIGISVIGTGKSASSLISALLKSGYRVNSVIGRTENSASSLAQKYNLPLFSHRIKDLPEDDNLIFIAVADDMIEKTALEISSALKIFKEKLFVHLSGACSSDLLRSLKERGSHTASFHIMFTFPSREAVDFSGAFAAVESEDTADKDLLFEIAHDLRLNPFEIKKEHKEFYHMMGVQASNFLSGLLFTAGKLASEAEIQENTYRLLEPIIFATLKNIKEKGASQSVSGPIDRGDVSTIKKHIQILRNSSHNKSALAAYAANSLVLIDAVNEKAGLLNEGQKKIKLLLIKTINELKL